MIISKIKNSYLVKNVDTGEVHSNYLPPERLKLFIERSDHRVIESTLTDGVEQVHVDGPKLNDDDASNIIASKSGLLIQVS